jgi:midasin
MEGMCEESKRSDPRETRRVRRHLFSLSPTEALPSDPTSLDQSGPRKRRKIAGDGLRVSAYEWQAFEDKVDEFDKIHVRGKGRLAFDFVEGPLVDALRAGHW